MSLTDKQRVGRRKSASRDFEGGRRGHIGNATSGAGFNRYDHAANNPYKFTDPDGRKVVLNGAKEEKKEIQELTKQIKESGPKGKAFIKGLEKGLDVLVSQGASVTRKDGAVVPLSATGGGLTTPPTESRSGKIEIVFEK